MTVSPKSLVLTPPGFPSSSALVGTKDVLPPARSIGRIITRTNALLPPEMFVPMIASLPVSNHACPAQSAPRRRPSPRAVVRRAGAGRRARDACAEALSRLGVTRSDLPAAAVVGQIRARSGATAPPRPHGL